MNPSSIKHVFLNLNLDLGNDSCANSGLMKFHDVNLRRVNSQKQNELSFHLCA